MQETTSAGAAARRYLAEAQALDRVLGLETAVDPARVEALAARIVQTTRRSPRPGKIVPLTPRKPTLAAAVPHRAGWAASAVLAASLLLGIFVGSGDATWPALSEVADAVGFGVLPDQLVLSSGEDGGLHDEDVL